MKKEYPYTMKLRDKTIHFRKWKVKDRKKFIKSIVDLNKSGTIDEQLAQSALVYDCLQEPNIVLNSDEFRYVITKIREESIGKTGIFNLTCNKCEKTSEYKLEIGDLIKPEFEPFNIISIDGVEITIGDVQSKNHYDDAITKCDTASDLYFTDLLYHVAEINGDISFTMDEAVEFFEDLDTDTFDKILEEWDKQKFTIDDINEIECKECKATKSYIFDEIPDFFPESWFKN